MPRFTLGENKDLPSSHQIAALLPEMQAYTKYIAASKYIPAYTQGYDLTRNAKSQRFSFQTVTAWQAHCPCLVARTSRRHQAVTGSEDVCRVVLRFYSDSYEP